MKFNKWTLGLAALGAVSLASAVQAEEAKATSVMTALSSTTLSGYVDTSMQWNVGTGNLFAPGYGFGGTAKADGFNLNVVRLVLAKDADAADSWGAGYKIDLALGPDGFALGLGGGVPVKQAYVDLKMPVGNGIDWKIGVFDTIIGYEVFQSADNPNVTRSWGYTIEPTTHTGVLASYQFTDWLSASVGIANTFGPGVNARAFNPLNGTQKESYKTYMAAVAFTAPKDWGFIAGSSLYACVINGFNAGSPAAGGAADQTHFYVGSTMNTPIKELKLGIAYDYVGAPQQNQAAPGVFATQSGYANAVALYSTFQATEKLTLSGRAEYASHSGGNGTGVAAGGSFPTKVISFTATAQYDLWKNVVSRLELRWDHAANGANSFGGETAGGGARLKNSEEVIDRDRKSVV